MKGYLIMKITCEKGKPINSEKQRTNKIPRKVISKRTFCLLTAVIIILSGLFSCKGASIVQPDGEAATVTASAYNDEAVTSLSQNEYEALTASVNSGEDYQNGKGTSKGGLYVSPYFTASANGTEIPVYAYVTYSFTYSSGVLHSFSEIEVSHTEESFYVRLSVDTSADFSTVKSAEGLELSFDGKEMYTYLTQIGNYTFLFGDEGEKYALTVMVREYVDEEAEIEALQEKYPAEYFTGITVYEPGVHYVDPIIFNDSIGAAVYLKRGAVLIAKHSYDINSDEDSKLYTKSTCESEKDAEYAADGLERRPLIGIFSSSHIEIAGRGLIDMSMLDLTERNGIYITKSHDISVRGITILNPSGIGIYMYRCSNADISGILLLGYRNVSYGILINNSQNIDMTGCFSRSRGNCFALGTLTAEKNSESDISNVAVKNCSAWSEGGSCFGISKNANLGIDGINFEDCSVISHRSGDPMRDASLSCDISVTEEDTLISGVSYINTRVFIEHGRAVLVNIYRDDLEECVLDFSFENITLSPTDSDCEQLYFNAKNSMNTIKASLSSVIVGDTKITADNLSEYAYIGVNSDITVK